MNVGIARELHFYPKVINAFHFCDHDRCGTLPRFPAFISTFPLPNAVFFFRDIKSKNILLKKGENGRLVGVLIDFSFSTVCSEATQDSPTIRREVRSPFYRASRFAWFDFTSGYGRLREGNFGAPSFSVEVSWKSFFLFFFFSKFRRFCSLNCQR